MPERLSAVYRQAHKALADLEHELAVRTQKLTELKTEAQQWETILGNLRRKREKPHTNRSNQRVDWQQIFTDLPEKFTLQDVVEQSGKEKSNIYVILSRWRKEKKAQQGPEGYQKAKKKKSIK